MASSGGGRIKDAVWKCFEDGTRLPEGRRTSVAVCKGCSAVVSAIVVRLRNHASGCRPLRELGLWTVLGPPRGQQTLRVTRTNPSETTLVHRALSRLLMSENLPFSLLQSPYLASFMDACRPGIKPLIQHLLLQQYMPMEFAEQHESLRGRVAGSMMSLSIDGWTAPSQQHTLGVALDNEFVSMQATNAPHTADFLAITTRSAIRAAREELDVTVIAVVTDGAANMVCEITPTRRLPTFFTPTGGNAKESRD